MISKSVVDFMKSKRLVYVLIACLCLMLCGCEKNLDNTQQSKNTAVSSAQEAAANGFEYEVCDAYVKITGYSKVNLPYLFPKP